MTGREHGSSELWNAAQARLVDTAQAFLQGNTGVIETARILSMVGHDLVDDWRMDPDFLIAGAIDTESDGLPIGDVRALWAPDALIERDRLIQAFEEHDRPRLEAACRSLLSRFGTSNGR